MKIKTEAAHPVLNRAGKFKFQNSKLFSFVQVIYIFSTRVHLEFRISHFGFTIPFRSSVPPGTDGAFHRVFDPALVSLLQPPPLCIRKIPSGFLTHIVLVL